MKPSGGEKIFSVFNHILIIIIVLSTLYPFYYVLVHSFNEGMDAARGGVYFWPRKFTLENYIKIFNQDYMEITVFSAYRITIMKTVLGTLASIATSGMFAYGLSRRNLPGVKLFLYYALVPMYFAGGLIPSFMIVKSLGLYNTFWVYILLFLVQPFYIMVLKAYFDNFPVEIEEASIIDGCNAIKSFYLVVIPLSMPVLATVSLYFAVWHWNDFTTPLIYADKSELMPIQNMIYNLIHQIAPASTTRQTLGTTVTTSTPQSILMAAALITSLPIIMVYPFLQKYFVKGFMLGAIKG